MRIRYCPFPALRLRATVEPKSADGRPSKALLQEAVAWAEGKVKLLVAANMCRDIAALREVLRNELTWPEEATTNHDKCPAKS